MAKTMPTIEVVKNAIAKRFDVAECLIQEIEYVNDEANYRTETPEQRYERVRRWMVENIKGETVVK
jgi:endonuclease V-like protein UPF0215 family